MRSPMSTSSIVQSRSFIVKISADPVSFSFFYSKWLFFSTYSESLPCDGRTIKEVETNVAYRWFLGLDENVPNFSMFGKNYIRRFQDTDVFETIFYRVLAQGFDTGFVDHLVLFINSTHIKANANKRNTRRKSFALL